MSDWIRIASDIELNYALYDAFVVLHGTDSQLLSLARANCQPVHLLTLLYSCVPSYGLQRLGPQFPPRRPRVSPYLLPSPNATQPHLLTTSSSSPLARSKTVILTGSQIPLSELFNDSIDNLLGALIVAGHYTIPEVCLFFNHKLLRGNRAIKASSEEFNAFDSPNLPPLANVGIEIGERLSLGVWMTRGSERS